MLLGSHLSIAGGLHLALEKAHRYRFDCLGLFVRNQIQWKVPALPEELVEKFRRTRRDLGIGPIVAHGSYLVNLCGVPAVRTKSIAAMREDLHRCERLGIEYLVVHPGSRARTKRGIRLIADALNVIVESTPRVNKSPRAARILLETMAGQGNSIGYVFEQLAAILELMERPKYFGICLDTCHIFAAGYDIRTPHAYQQTILTFDRIIGLRRLLAIHLNDSRRDLGSRVDRHAHIGTGAIGRKPLANFVNDPRFQRIPMILETPKGTDEKGRDWDEVNAQVIRKLARAR